jgi:YebC/PmpR family DNA-binding regulatory protein
MKGTGELPGTTYEESIYEGYGPGGAAIMMEVMTDNKNRTVSEIRYILSKNGGNLGESGCVSWIFDKKGYILVEKTKIDEDALMSIVLDAGAEDMKNDPKEENYEIITTADTLETVKDAIQRNKIDISLAEVTMLPKNYVPLEGPAAEQMLRLIDGLEDHDDIQNVYANFDVTDDSLKS